MERDTIQLPDGREFNIKDLLDKTTRSRNYNLQKQRRAPVDSRVPRAFAGATQVGKTVKYTIEDRKWQAEAKPEEIQARYNITLKQASMIRYQSRYILDQLDIAYKY